MNTPNLDMPQLGGDADHAQARRAPKSASQKAREAEGLINKIMVVAAVLLGLALVYGIFSATGKPFYFH